MDGLNKKAGAVDSVNCVKQNDAAAQSESHNSKTAQQDWFQSNNKIMPEWAYKVKIVDPELIKQHATILNFDEDM